MNAMPHPATPAEIETSLSKDSASSPATLRSGTGPVNEGAKVVMGLDEKNHAELVAYIQNHLALVQRNPLFATVHPPESVFHEMFTAYQKAVLAAMTAETVKRQAVARQAQMRREMNVMLRRRAAYIQGTSNGNRQAILSSGLQVRNQATPVTELAAPMNLSVTLNGEAGVVKLQWAAVRHALTYRLEYRRADEPVAWQALSITTKVRVTKTLPVGVTYVFRVAAQGTPGQSNWSAEVIRGAA